jgi:hypothetical protein
MPNKILVLKNNKNIENECGSDTWQKKTYFIYILLIDVDRYYPHPK